MYSNLDLNNARICKCRTCYINGPNLSRFFMYPIWVHIMDASTFENVFLYINGNG